MATIKYKDSTSNWVEIPTVQGPIGPMGPQGETGPAGGILDVAASATEGYITVTNADGTTKEVIVGAAGDFLPLAGGTMTGNIYSTRTGGAFFLARDNALLNYNTSIAISSFAPVYSLKGISGDFACGILHYISGESEIKWIYTLDSDYTNGNNNSTHLMTLSSTGVLTSTKVYGAVWNDYAEFRRAPELPAPGRTVVEVGDGTMVRATERLQPGAKLVSDTFGFAIGETDECKTPIAVSGRVLAYPLEDRESYQPGDAVCTGPNGTVSRMTREEIREYPERIIGTVSEIPTYSTWGTGNVEVKGRIWIYVR